MKRPRPDRRPKWHDPNLPCIRDYTFGDGTKKIEVDPDYERRYREHLISTDTTHPSWKSDPSYNWNRKAKP